MPLGLKFIVSWLASFLPQNWNKSWEIVLETTLFLVRFQDESDYRWSKLPFGMIAARCLIKGNAIVRIQIAKSWKSSLDIILDSADMKPGDIEVEWKPRIDDNVVWA
jgi:hypothetical protein